MKQCINCGELKDDSLFSIGRNQCKECTSQYKKQYYLDHIEERKQYRKQYYLDHKEERTQQIKQYYLVHKEEIKQYHKQYYLNHIEETKQHYLDHIEENKQYYQDHKEEIKQYRQNRKEEIKQYDKQYRQTENGKFSRKKDNAKRRNIKYIPLMNNPFPEEISVDYHHVLNNFHAIDANNPWNKMFVVPIPRLTHRFIGGNADNLAHWKFNTLWIRKLYCIDIKELLGIEKN